MPGQVGISIEALHWVLWERRVPLTNEVRVDQAKLANELMVSRSRVTQVVGVLIEEGRLERIPGARSDYAVRDPAKWVSTPPAENSV